MVQALRSQLFLGLVLFLALASQIPHTAEVFHHYSSGIGIASMLHAYAYASALELAILLFVAHAKHKESYLFALISILVNLCYYAMQVSLFSVAALPAWLMSLALPIAIGLFSHTIASYDNSVAHKNNNFTLKFIAIHLRKLFKKELDTTQIVSPVFIEPANHILEGVNTKPQDARMFAQELRNSGEPLASIAQEVGKSISWVSRYTTKNTLK